jgi:hypothetical protein
MRCKMRILESLFPSTFIDVRRGRISVGSSLPVAAGAPDDLRHFAPIWIKAATDVHMCPPVLELSNGSDSLGCKLFHVISITLCRSSVALSSWIARSESVWIYVYSYRRADPECANPSGSVNFSARLEIGVNGFMSDLSTPSTTDDDVFCRRGRNVGVYSTNYCKMYYTTGSTRRINADGSRCRGVCVRLFVRCTVCSAQTHLARPFVREIQNSPPNKTHKGQICDRATCTALQATGEGGSVSNRVHVHGDVKTETVP